MSACGAANFEEVPGREQYSAGDDATAQWVENMLAFHEENSTTTRGLRCALWSLWTGASVRSRRKREEEDERRERGRRGVGAGPGGWAIKPYGFKAFIIGKKQILNRHMHMHMRMCMCMCMCMWYLWLTCDWQL